MESKKIELPGNIRSNKTAVHPPPSVMKPATLTRRELGKPLGAPSRPGVFARVDQLASTRVIQHNHESLLQALAPYGGNLGVAHTGHLISLQISPAPRPLLTSLHPSTASGLPACWFSVGPILQKGEEMDDS